ncbi:hypothetical protein RJ639_036068 [Escallonia herrerae]|uniref:DUF674 family protein n=1 Tax=Escallonia herrerae TaxID=1293975 RepID=A0AA88WUR5_9ASTE|nr:hypothetical protein RJ639_036068 [Escallonia herrerae]
MKQGPEFLVKGGEELTLKILVDKAQNKVLFAEAGEEFVDILLSFLTQLPLGTIVRLLSMPSDSSQLKFGSLTTLYQSVSALQTKHFWTKVGKDMLLNPKNSAAAQCQKLKIDIDDTARTKYFMCPDRLDYKHYGSHLLSTLEDLKCTCGSLMNTQMELVASDVRLQESTSEVFVTETASFIITDDLQIMPNLLGTTVVLFSNHGKTDMNVLETRTLKVRVEEDLKDMLLEPLLAQKFLCKNQILPIREVSPRPFYYRFDSRDLSMTNTGSRTCSQVTYTKDPTGGTTVVGGFVKGPATFMVTDDFVVTPFSSLSVISALKRLNLANVDFYSLISDLYIYSLVPALGLLKASLDSTSALTDVLSLMLQKPKQEKNP